MTAISDCSDGLKTRKFLVFYFTIGSIFSESRCGFVIMPENTTSSLRSVKTTTSFCSLVPSCFLFVLEEKFSLDLLI